MAAIASTLLFLFIIGTGIVASDPDLLQDICVADRSSAVKLNGFSCKEAANVTAADFFFDGLAKPGTVNNSVGSLVTGANVEKIPGLNTLGVSLARIDYVPGGLNPPHTHPRATEVVFVLEGQLDVGFITTANVLISKTIKKGEIFVFPKGLVHFQKNNGDERERERERVEWRMAQVIRPLRTQQPIICSSCSTFLRILSPFLPNKSSTSPLQQHHHQRRRLTSFVTLPLSNRNVDFRSHGLRLSESALPPDLAENDSDSDYSSSEKSRNAKKREARRAVKWGMELASFSAPQIKRILSVASLEREVFEALMLVKRLGPDVREGKRRQFNYIGRLLRKVEPELMDALIQASKEGDNSKLQALSGTGPSTIVEDEEELEEIESEEEEEEGLHISHNYIDLATRWIEGLISKDSDITNEVYSIHSVEFDRQELRKLVRRVHSIQEQQLKSENEGASDTALVGARKSLSLFLRSLAKQMPIEEDH